MAALLILWTIFFIGAISVFMRLLNQVWLKPRRIRAALWKQGVRGPPVSFLYGNVAEMEKLDSTVKAKRRHVSQDWALSVHPFLSKWGKEYGPVSTYSTGSLQHLVISDANLVQAVRVSNPTDLGRPAYMNKNFHALIGDSIFLTNGEKWSYQRRVIAPEFFHEKDMLGIMVKYASAKFMGWERRVNESKSGVAEITVDEDLSAIAREILSEASFGWSYAEVGEQIFKNVDKMGEVFAEQSSLFGFLSLRLFPSRKDKVLNSLQKEVDDLILHFVRKRQAKMQDGSSQKDLLHSMIESAYSPDLPAGMSPHSFILDACKSMYLAVADSTAMSLAWTLMFLALHQEWQERIRAEIFEVCGDQDIHQCLQQMDTLPKLKTLQMLIQETLRLYAQAGLNTKEALTDLKLGDLTVPKGTIVWIFIPKLLRDPEIWGPDADEFKPERFANGVANSCKYPAAYAPFGLGSRICLGQIFVHSQMKIVLSLLLSKFKVSLSPSSNEHYPIFTMTLRPGHGMKLLFTPLQAKDNQMVQDYVK